MKLLSVIAAAALVLAGCATVKTNTASGRPEVTVAGSKSSAVKSYITSEMLNRGYAVHSSSDTVIVFDKLAPVNAGTTWLAMSLGPITVRTSYTIVALGGGVRVMGEPAMVQWAGTAREAPVAGAFTAPQPAVDDVNAVLGGVRNKFGV
jgi:hypothetical protein